MLYDDLSPFAQSIADRLEDANLGYRIYNKGVQFNAWGSDNVIHSFYPTTGTILLHAGNEKNNRKTITYKNETIDTFIDLLSGPGRIKQLFE